MSGIRANWLFTDRKGGASAPPFSGFNLAFHVGDDPAAVRRNRQLLAEKTAADIVWMDQVHSATVAVVTRPVDGAVPRTDALVTTTPGLALAVMVADCVPVLAYDEAAGVIGVAHAGRVGAAAGIVPTLLNTMVEQGARRGQLTVVLGPAVCGRCYEVPAAMQAEVEQALPGSAGVTASGTAALDLRAGLAAQVEAAGVLHCEVSTRCTVEDLALFSHRREAPTGRQAGLIWLTGVADSNG